MNYEALLQKKLESIFPNLDERQKVTAILESYGKENHEKEIYRVRLAVLKLSGSDISQIEKNTRCAREDYRDILSWAEYPGQSKKGPMPDGPEKQEVTEADRKQYEEWLNS